MVTLELSIVALSVSMLIGIVMAYARLSPHRMVSGAASAYVEFVRNIPLLLIMFFIYFGLPAFQVTLTERLSAVLALSLYSGAYMTEIFRAGILAVGLGQVEAGLELHQLVSRLGADRAQQRRAVVAGRQGLADHAEPFAGRVVAQQDDGSIIDVTRRALYQSNAPDLASVDERGLVEAIGIGDAAIIVRYRDEPAIAMALVTRPGGVAIPAVKPHNFVDAHILAKLGLSSRVELAVRAFEHGAQ